MSWQSGNYISGLAQGKSGRKINFRVKDDVLEVGQLGPALFGGWREKVPVGDITGAEIQDAERISGMRVLATGGLGLFWKKHDRFLVLQRDGALAPIVITAKVAALDKVLREMQLVKTLGGLTDRA